MKKIHFLILSKEETDNGIKIKLFSENDKKIYYSTFQKNKHNKKLLKNEYFEGEVIKEYGMSIQFKYIRPLNKENYSKILLDMNEEYKKNKELIEKLVIKLQNKKLKNELFEKIYNELIKKNLNVIKFYPATIFKNFNFPGGLIIKNNLLYDIAIKNLKTFNLIKSTKNINKDLIFLTFILMNSVIEYDEPILKELNSISKLIDPQELLLLKIYKIVEDYLKDYNEIKEKLEQEILNMNNKIENMEKNKTIYKEKKLKRKEELNKKLIELRNSYKKIEEEIKKIDDNKIDKIKELKEKLNEITKEGKNIKEEIKKITENLEKYLILKEEKIQNFKENLKIINKEVKKIIKIIETNKKEFGNLVHCIKTLKEQKPRTIEANIVYTTYLYFNMNIDFFEEHEMLKKEKQKQTFSTKFNRYLFID